MIARLATPLCLAACLATLLFGCARQPAGSAGIQAPPMNLSDFYGFCSALPTPDGCFSDPLCQRYRKELAVAPADLPGCLDLCQRLENDLYVSNLTNGCENILERAQDLCDQFCRRRNDS